jgi:biopolymer transport protein ExbD
MRHRYHGWTKTAVKWPRRIHCKMDAFPILGLALVLLIIFMIVPAVTAHHGWSLDLPRSQYASPMPRAVREDAQIVDIARDGQVYYRNVRIIVDELPDQIRQSVRHGADRKIYIRADTRARYIDVKKIFSEIGKAGIQNVCFLAEQVSP